MSINSQEELCEHLSSIQQTQNLIFKEIKNLKEKVEEPYKITENLISDLNKVKQTNERLESLLAKLITDNSLEKISTQLNKLKLGPSSSNISNNNFILAKPRPKKS